MLAVGVLKVRHRSMTSVKVVGIQCTRAADTAAYVHVTYRSGMLWQAIHVWLYMSCLFVVPT